MVYEKNSSSHATLSYSPNNPSAALPQTPNRKLVLQIANREVPRHKNREIVWTLQGEEGSSQHKYLLSLGKLKAKVLCAISLLFLIMVSWNFLQNSKFKICI